MLTVGAFIKFMYCEKLVCALLGWVDVCIACFIP